MHEINPLWIPIVGILMPLVLVPMIMVLKHRTLRREWQHKERMKAMEMGGPLPIVNAGRRCRRDRAGVPIASVIAAAVTSLSTSRPQPATKYPSSAIAWGLRRS